MTTINTIEDLARILRDQPTWAAALRALLLTQELLDLPGRFDRFVEVQREFNQAQQETNRLTDQRLNAIEGQIGNLQGGQYERSVRTKALARSMIALGFEVPYVALNQDGLTAPRLTSAIAQALRDGLVTPEGSADLFEADIIISAEDNRHAVVEVSLTADRDDIDRAKTRAGILAAITEGAVTPGRHHVEAEPGPIGPGGSGGSDHLRHTVSVSRGQAQPKLTSLTIRLPQQVASPTRVASESLPLCVRGIIRSCLLTPTSRSTTPTWNALLSSAGRTTSRASAAPSPSAWTPIAEITGKSWPSSTS